MKTRNTLVNVIEQFEGRFLCNTQDYADVSDYQIKRRVVRIAQEYGVRPCELVQNLERLENIGF